MNDLEKFFGTVKTEFESRGGFASVGTQLEAEAEKKLKPYFIQSALAGALIAIIYFEIRRRV